MPGGRNREHESVANQELYSFVAGGFSGKAQLNAPDLEREPDVDIWFFWTRRLCNSTYLVVLAEVADS